MTIKQINIGYCIILAWWLFGFGWIQMGWSYDIFGIIWELTFIPSLIAAFAFSLYSIYLQLSRFQRLLSYYFNLALSIIFIIYFAVMVYALLESIQNYS